MTTSTSTSVDPWVIILAGGRGNRLSTVSTAIYGYARPKQFCRFGGEESLLCQTLARARLVVAPERIVVVTTRSHRREAMEELAAWPRVRWCEQPGDRGTLPGLLLPLQSILPMAADAPVFVMPSDHWVDDDAAFVHTFTRAAAEVARRTEDVILVGARPHGPLDGYGWIVRVGDEAESQRVAAFVEKPARGEIGALLHRDALINTFGMVARGAALSSMMKRAHASWWRRLQGSLTPEQVESAYADLPPVDFSKQALQAQPERLRVVALEGVRWSDVGTPERLELTHRAEVAAVV